MILPCSCVPGVLTLSSATAVARLRLLAHVVDRVSDDDVLDSPRVSGRYVCGLSMSLVGEVAVVGAFRKIPIRRDIGMTCCHVHRHPLSRPVDPNEKPGGPTGQRSAISASA